MFPEQKKPWLRVNLRTLVVAVVLLIAGFGAGLYVGTRAEVAMLVFPDAAMPSDVDLSPVWKAWHVIDEKFVPAAVATSTPMATSTAQRNEQRVWGMISGMADSLNDPYTYFLPPVENQQFNEDLNGSFEGVGMEIAVRKGALTVVSPLKGSPAEAAGLKSGDLILKIGDEDTNGLDVETAVQKIRGPKGTQIPLLIMRDGWSAPKVIKVTRDVINVPTIETKEKNGVFVIQVLTFTSNSPDLFRDALRKFVESGDTRLVLDLRGNPGGYLEAAVSMASWFLPSGKVVVTEDYAGHAENIVHRSYGYDVFNGNLKMVILVDRGSASASEILADALRYYGVATMMGTNTFGKGSVQELVDITDKTALKLTVARWLGPDGKQIPPTGLIPNTKIEITDDDVKAGKDPQLDKAIHMLNTQ